MRETRTLMSMDITVEIVDAHADSDSLARAFDYFNWVDKQFSTFKETSEISQINRGEILPEAYSSEMQEIFAIAEKTRVETNGFFDIHRPNGTIDPAGIVKGWAIQNAAELLIRAGFQNLQVDAGGDIQSYGHNESGTEWSFGIRNPFVHDEIIKVVYPHSHGIATSGTYERGQHIYNPRSPNEIFEDIMSITVIGPNVLEADRFATGAFAMGKDGILFIENLNGFEGYAIDSKGIATMTSGFETFTTSL